MAGKGSKQLTYDGLFKFVEKNKHLNQPDVVEVITDYEVIKKSSHIDLLIKIKDMEKFKTQHPLFSYFKGVNAVEFKSIADRVEHPKDIYTAVMIYSSLILSGTARDGDITYTIITAHYPRKHFSEIGEENLRRIDRGIYDVEECRFFTIRFIVLNELDIGSDEDRFVLKMFSGNRKEFLKKLELMLREGNTGVVEKYTDELYLLIGDELKNLLFEEKPMTVIEKNLYKFAKEKGWIDNWVSQGIKQGIKQGLEQGIKQAQFDIAKNLIAMNLPLQDISKATGIDIETLEKLKEEMNL